MIDWFKYKDMLTDADLEAVKKLCVLLQMSEALNIRKKGNIMDISCDILGDSVIVKVMCNGDSSLELYFAKKCGAEFLKAFKKNLEML